MESLRKYGLLSAMIIVAVILVPAGGAKLAGVPQMHASFSVLGLPVWFGYFIGACEIAGAIGLFIRRLSALAAIGISIIMLGALYFHAIYTPIAQGIPSMLVLLLCAYIFSKRSMPFRLLADT